MIINITFYLDMQKYVKKYLLQKEKNLIPLKQELKVQKLNSYKKRVNVLVKIQKRIQMQLIIIIIME